VQSCYNPVATSNEQEIFVANIKQERYRANLPTIITKFGSHTTNSHFMLPSLV